MKVQYQHDTLLHSKVVPRQDFRFDTDTNIFILIPLNKFYPTDIIKLSDILTDTSLLT